MLEKTIQETNSLFEQPWWLDAVAPGCWGEATVEKEGRIVGRMPYVLRNRFGMTMLSMPPLTPFLGPWIEKKETGYTKSLAWQKDVFGALIDSLPSFSSFNYLCHYDMVNWLPFYWKGYKQSTLYTYVLQDLNDMQKLWSGMLGNIRTDIGKAEKKLSVRSDIGLDVFFDVLEKTFLRQGLRLPFPRDLVRRIDEACGDNHRRIFFAQDERGRVHAVLFIVWDERSAYGLLNGGDPDLRNSGANSLLWWEAIKFASTVTHRFDFEGSMVESIERFFRAFGAVQTPYFALSKSTPGMTLLRSLRSGAKFFLRRR
jgi:hypothetical protein